MGGKKKYIEMFGSFMEPFNFLCVASTSEEGYHITKYWSC